MPTYRIKLANGGSLVLRGDVPPTDADVEAAADAAGVRSLLMTPGGETPAQEPSLSTTRSPISPGVALGAGMAAAPAAVSLVNRAAGVAGRVAAGRAAGLVPAVVALDAGADVLRGDPKRAAMKAGGAVAASQVPRVLRAVQAATAPARTVAGGASAVLQASGVPYPLPPVTTPGGLVSRAAGALSRFAGPVGLAVETMFGDGAAGHRPAGETAETTAHRQSDLAMRFKNDVNQQAGREVITGSTTEEILDSILCYRQGQGR